VVAGSNPVAPTIFCWVTMYLMYVDESGDPGINNSPTQYFILSAIVLHELRWSNFLDELIYFRRSLSQSKGLKLREEIHAGAFINDPGDLKRIKRNDRLDILKKCMDWTANQNDISIITICTDKTKHSSEDIFDITWQRLIQRFENTISHRNFPGPVNPDERGLILADNTDGTKLTKIIRRMRRYNPISNARMYCGNGYRNIPLQYVIEDPIFRHSYDSLIIQMVDVIAYCAMQLYKPNSYMKKKGGHRFYSRLRSVINPYVVRSGHPLSIVEI
jgi:hypothetical protein